MICRLFAIAALTAVFLSPPPAAFAQGKDQALEMALADAHFREDFNRLIREAQETDQGYARRIAEAERLRAQSEFYVLRDKHGGLLMVSHDEARNLAAEIALEIYLTDDNFASLRQLAAGALGGSQLDEAIMTTLTKTGQQLSPRIGAMPAPANLARFAHASLIAAIEELDAANKEQLAVEIEALRARQQHMADLIGRAVAARDKREAPDAPPGFMNEAGYYVVQKSGAGWRKKGAGKAHRIEGYQDFVVKVTEEVAEPYRTGNGLWILPLGTDLMKMARLWQAEAKEKSIRACERGKPSCPCKAQPDIWDDGPVYGLVDGPFQSNNEALDVAGNPRGKNLAAGSAKHWDYDKKRKYEEVKAACDALIGH